MPHRRESQPHIHSFTIKRIAHQAKRAILFNKNLTVSQLMVFFLSVCAPRDFDFQSKRSTIARISLHIGITIIIPPNPRLDSHQVPFSTCSTYYRLLY